MSFGSCPHTGKTFAEKFHASVYEALPPPSTVTSEVQFQRAMEIEAAFVPGSVSDPTCHQTGAWKDGSKRYLFFMLNESPDPNCDNPPFCKGGFYDSPTGVKWDNFFSINYPASFRWFVIDPTVKEEVAYMATQMDNFWFDTTEKERKEWWYPLLHSHGLSPEEENALDNERNKEKYVEIRKMWHIVV